jgi:iron complex transport system substrate-binding protein
MRGTASPRFRIPHLDLAVVLCAIAPICFSTACRRSDALPPAAWPAVRFAEAPRANLTNACVDRFDPALDYFPDKATIGYAHFFRVSYFRHYKVIDFVPDVGSHETVRYVLVQCGAPVPRNLGGAHVVQVPIKRAVLAKLEFASTFVDLGAQDQLVGVASINGIAVPEILDRYHRGQVREVGSGTHSSIEMALALDPDVVFTFYSAFADSNTHPKLWDVGITGVPLADHFEPTPLGRSEWMKFVALFFNQERRAEELFSSITERYDRVRQRAATATTRTPAVLGWANSRQQWALNGGRNYVARMIEDAGGRYVWQSPSMRSIDLIDFERIYDLAGPAEIWIGNQIGHKTLGSLVAWDPRLRHFGPVERRAVYNNDRGRLPSGAFPYASESLARPDAVLADLMAMLHPELLPDHGLHYYYELAE